MSDKQQIQFVADGEIAVWIDDAGVICLKTNSAHRDPVELAEHEALALAETLTSMVNVLRGDN